MLSMPNIPFDVVRPSLLNFNGKPLSCGGERDYDDFKTECLYYEDNKWNLLAHMTTPRKSALIAQLSDDSFIVMGGRGKEPHTNPTLYDSK